jgi:hypothetical protein
MRRREFMRGFGGAAAMWSIVSVASLSSILRASGPARGQGDAWQLYRREDLGFEVEMPDAPKIEVQEGQDKDAPVAKSVDAQVDFQGINFGILYEEWRGRPSVDDEIAAQRFGARSLGTKVISETRFTMNGVPGVEIATDGFGGTTFRIVIEQNRRFFLGAAGAPSDNASVRRFFDSFRLLSAGR